MKYYINSFALFNRTKKSVVDSFSISNDLKKIFLLDGSILKRQSGDKFKKTRNQFYNELIDSNYFGTRVYGDDHNFILCSTLKKNEISINSDDIVMFNSFLDKECKEDYMYNHSGTHYSVGIIKIINSGVYIDKRISFFEDSEEIYRCNSMKSISSFSRIQKLGNCHTDKSLLDRINRMKNASDFIKTLLK